MSVIVSRSLVFSLIKINIFFFKLTNYMCKVRSVRDFLWPVTFVQISRILIAMSKLR